MDNQRARTKRKLELDKERLRNLVGSELPHVRGGQRICETTIWGPGGPGGPTYYHC